MICLDSDNEDDHEARHTISRSSPAKPPPQDSPVGLRSLVRTVSPPVPLKAAPPKLSSLAGLSTTERIELEKARRARANRGVAETALDEVKPRKRGIDESGSPSRVEATRVVPSRPAKSQKTAEAALVSQLYGKREGSTTASESADSNLGKMGSKKPGTNKVEDRGVKLASESSDDEGSGLQYPNGVVKRTFLEGVERKGDDITIEEVLQRVGVL